MTIFRARKFVGFDGELFYWKFKMCCIFEKFDFDHDYLITT